MRIFLIINKTVLLKHYSAVAAASFTHDFTKRKSGVREVIVDDMKIEKKKTIRKFYQCKNVSVMYNLDKERSTS